MIIYVILQLKFATVDLELHSKYVPGGSETIYDVDRRVSEKTQVIPPLPEDRFLCGFSHIFAGWLYLFFFHSVGLGQFADKCSVTSFYPCYLIILIWCWVSTGGYAAGYYSYKVYFFFAIWWPLITFFKCLFLGGMGKCSQILIFG